MSIPIAPGARSLSAPLAMAKKKAATKKAPAKAQRRKKATRKTKSTRAAAKAALSPSSKKKTENLSLDAAIAAIKALKNKATSLSIVTEQEISNKTINEHPKSNLQEDYNPSDNFEFKKNIRHELISILQDFYREQINLAQNKIDEKIPNQNANNQQWKNRKIIHWDNLFKASELIKIRLKLDKTPQSYALAPKDALFDIKHITKDGGQIILVVKPPELKS